MEKTVLNVQGMSCGHCVAAVQGALDALAGVSNVQVDLASGKAEVEYDPAQAKIEAMRAAIEDLGFDVE